MRGSPKSNKATTPSNSAVPIGGKVFDDGTVLELIQDLSQPNSLALLKWDGRRIVISRRVVYQGKAYVPLALDPGVRRALRLPSSCSGPASTAALFRELVAVVTKYTDLAENTCGRSWRLSLPRGWRTAFLFL